MANEFYHEINVTFNAWFVIGPVFLVLMMLSGIGKYKLSKKLRILKRDEDDWLLNTIAVVLDAILHTIIIVESIGGILQYTINHLDTHTDVAWVPFVVIVELFLSSIIVWAIFFAAGKFGQFLRYQYLQSKRHKILAEKVRIAKS